MPTLEDVRLFAKHHLYRRVVDHPAKDAELGVVPLGYEKDAYEARLRSYDGKYRVEERAVFSYQGARHTVFSIASGTGAANQRILVLAGVHGNEHAGILAIPDLLDAFDARRTELPNVELLVLSPVNPIGAACFSRYNGEGYDINRDFARFETHEARAVRVAFEDFRPTFVVALHEGPQDATFMFTNAEVDGALAERLLSALEAGGTVLATHDYFGRKLVPKGLAASSRVSEWLVKLWAGGLGMMTTNAYASREGIPEITLESSWRSEDRAARLRAHVDLVMALATELSLRASPARPNPG